LPSSQNEINNINGNSLAAKEIARALMKALQVTCFMSTADKDRFSNEHALHSCIHDDKKRRFSTLNDKTARYKYILSAMSQCGLLNEFLIE